MGIRFTCPNGHKLNVKSNLAGRRGWCPHCGVPVEIPLQSTRESSRTKRHGDAIEPPESLSNVQNSPAVQSESASPASSSATVGGSGLSSVPNGMSAQVVEHGGEYPSKVPSKNSEIDPAVMATVEAVLNEKPNAVWYLHQGESQRGPFLMDSMRDFFQNSQIESDAIIWREDWSDWREVTEVFPALFPMFAPPPPPMSESAMSVTPPMTNAVQDFLQNTIQGERGPASPGMSQVANRGKKKSTIPINGITALCIFAISLLLLGVGACWMLTHSGGDAENVTEEPTPEVLTEPTEPTDTTLIDSAKSTKPIEPHPSTESTESITPVVGKENTAPVTETPKVTDTSTTVPVEAKSTTTK